MNEQSAPKRIPLTAPKRSMNATTAMKQASDGTSINAFLIALHLTLCHAPTIRITAQDERGILAMNLLQSKRTATQRIAAGIPAKFLRLWVIAVTGINAPEKTEQKQFVAPVTA